MPSYYLNNYCNIVNWTIGNKLQWNLHWNLHILIQGKAFEFIVKKLAAILSRPQCVKRYICSNDGDTELNDYIMWLSKTYLDVPSHIHTFCEARRASHCHSPQITYSSKSTCCVLSAQKSAMHVVVYADRLTTQHSIVDISDWSWSYCQIWYPSWHVECFWPALAAHKFSSASHISVLPPHPRWEIVPHRVG